MIISAVLISFGALPVFAQTATTTSSLGATTTSSSSVQDQIQALLAQIAALKEQIAALINNNASLQGAVNQIQNTLKISTPLRVGMRGEDVKTLQSVLATDPTLFSKDNVTGYFGPLTAEAVANFQKHFGIQAVGLVGPHTMEKINELLKEHGVQREEDLSENDLGDLGDTNEQADANATSTSQTSGEHRDSKEKSGASEKGDN